MQDIKKTDEPPPESQVPAPGLGEPTSSQTSEQPCPFPPDEIVNTRDIRNLYGLCWLSKS